MGECDSGEQAESDSDGRGHDQQPPYGGLGR
jgi:hypothetical protein